METFHAEVGCSRILFNDPFGIPLVAVDKRAKRNITNLIASLRQEQGDTDLAYGEVMLAYLKVLLILAARIKAPQAGACTPGANDLRHPVLAESHQPMSLLGGGGGMCRRLDLRQNLHPTMKTR